MDYAAQCIISSKNKIVIKKILKRPVRKAYSATVSYISARFVLLRIDRNAHKQLVINSTNEMAVTSSIIVTELNLKSLIDVNTTKQNPRKLEEAFNICGALLLLFPSLFVCIAFKCAAGFKTIV